MKIHASAENYLEAILILSKSGNPVRSVDVSAHLDYTKPSVSIAMKKLRSDNYIEVDENGFITLTDSGLQIAESMYERHLLLSDWLVSLGVNKELATEDACKIEHCISDKSFDCLKAFLRSDKCQQKQ